MRTLAILLLTLTINQAAEGNPQSVEIKGPIEVWWIQGGRVGLRGRQITLADHLVLASVARRTRVLTVYFGFAVVRESPTTATRLWATGSQLRLLKDLVKWNPSEVRVRGTRRPDGSMDVSAVTSHERVELTGLVMSRPDDPLNLGRPMLTSVVRDSGRPWGDVLLHNLQVPRFRLQGRRVRVRGVVALRNDGSPESLYLKGIAARTNSLAALRSRPNRRSRAIEGTLGANQRVWVQSTIVGSRSRSPRTTFHRISLEGGGRYYMDGNKVVWEDVPDPSPPQETSGARGAAGVLRAE